LRSRFKREGAKARRKSSLSSRPSCCCHPTDHQKSSICGGAKYNSKSVTRSRGGGSAEQLPTHAAISLQNGNLNRDGALTSADTAIALAIAVGGGSASWDPTTLAAADVNHEGQVTSLEVLIGTV